MREDIEKAIDNEILRAVGDISRAPVAQDGLPATAGRRAKGQTWSRRVRTERITVEMCDRVERLRDGAQAKGDVSKKRRRRRRRSRVLVWKREGIEVEGEWKR
ncbi:MAG: hypothetical protein JRI97_10690 [Deltaproteobacteria bacterium]|nr:hypothetical protein [Deltaproteobacteria bacterium]